MTLHLQQLNKEYLSLMKMAASTNDRKESIYVINQASRLAQIITELENDVLVRY